MALNANWKIIKGRRLGPKALNDDLSSKVDDERDKKLLDCPINDPDAILQIMFSGRHISVNWDDLVSAT